MAQSEFSETQFTFSFLSEYQFGRSIGSPFYFLFPTSKQESWMAVDYLADFYSHSEYYQFKRSEYLGTRRGKREIKEELPLDYVPYYRFLIYNKSNYSGEGQFDILRKIANEYQDDLVCYCAPCFHNEFEFFYYYTFGSLVSNSILIETEQFNKEKFRPPHFNVDDGDDHYLIYRIDRSDGYICSDPIKIKIHQVEDKSKLYEKNQGKESLFKTIDFHYKESYLVDDNVKNKIEIDKESKAHRLMIGIIYLYYYYNIIWLPVFNHDKGVIPNFRDDLKKILEV